MKGGPDESRVPRLELISKIPEGEVCNYLGIMDTLGGPANFRSNYRIRSRCGRRFIGHVDGQATYKLRFLFYPYGQPDLSLFLIRIPRLSFFSSSSSITNLYRLFSKKQPFNGSRFLRNAYNIFGILIFLSLFISDFDINKNLFEKFETGEEMQFLSSRIHETRSKVALPFQGWVKKNLGGGERVQKAAERSLSLLLPILSSLSPRNGFCRIFCAYGDKVERNWSTSGSPRVFFSLPFPADILLSYCSRPFAARSDQARNAAGPWIRGSSGGTRCQADRNYQ